MTQAYAPGLIQIRPQYTRDPDVPDTPENITWWQSTSSSTPTLANLASIAAIFDANWPQIWKNIAYTAAKYIGNVITDWSSNTGLSGNTVGTLTPVAGTEGTETAGAQVCALMSGDIGLRYRGGHARTYFPTVGAIVLDTAYGDQINTGNLSAMATAWAALDTAMVGSGVLGGQKPAIFRFRNDPAKAEVALISSVTFQAQIATQRRRARKVTRR